MNARQRRIVMRRRPKDGSTVAWRRGELHLIGIVQYRQYERTSPNVVRVQFDNGEYATWDYVPMQRLTLLQEPA